MHRLFAFESGDSLAQFNVWIVPVAGGGVVAGLLFQYGEWPAVLACFLACSALVLGLRASIDVTMSEVIIVRRWFFLSCKTHRAAEIEDVWFGGDYGLEEGAIGVAVQLAGKEVHIGTRKNKRQLHDALWPIDFGEGYS